MLSSRAPIGYMAIARNELTTNQGFKSFIPTNGYSTAFIYYTVKNSLKAITQYASGSSFKEISAAVLKTIKISLPKSNVVDQFSKTVEPLFKRQDLLEQENQHLTQLRDWLLPLVLFNDDHGGDWDRYLDAIHAWFKQDFVDTKPVFQGRRLGLKRQPMTHGKEATFWHMIQEGEVEEERTPDFRRCERIRWPKPIIERDTDPAIKVWRNRRGREERVCLWLVQQATWSFWPIAGITSCRGRPIWLNSRTGSANCGRNMRNTGETKAQKAEAAPGGGFVTPATHGR